MNHSAIRGRSQSNRPEKHHENDFATYDGKSNRSKSPGRLLMQVHDRLIEESHNKDCLANDLDSLKRRIQEFSIRLDFILKCMW